MAGKGETWMEVTGWGARNSGEILGPFEFFFFFDPCSSSGLVRSKSRAGGDASRENGSGYRSGGVRLVDSSGGTVL